MIAPRLLALAGLLVGCAGGRAGTDASARAPSPAPRRAPPSYVDLELRPSMPARDEAAALAAGEVEGDLALLFFALRRGYAGERFVPKASWAAMTGRLDALRGRPTTVRAFCDGIGDALWQLPDAHVGAMLEEPGGARRRCGVLGREARRRPEVGKNRARAEGGSEGRRTPWRVERISTERGTTAVLSLAELPYHEDPVWGAFTASIAELARSDALMIDLRGNDGGDDTRGLELAQLLRGGAEGTRLQRMHLRITPEALTLGMNGYEAERRPDGTLEPHVAARLEAERRRRDEAARSGAPEWHVREAPRAEPPGPKAYRGPIAILADAGCASSCESILDALRQHPRAKVFGEPTAGFINFGETGELRLPASGIRLAIPSKYFEYPDGAFYDKAGFAPDVPVAKGEDAFAAALAWLRGPR